MSRAVAKKALKGLNLVSVGYRNFRHEDADGNVHYLPTPHLVVDAQPMNWHGEPVKYGHYVKVRSKFDGDTYCVQSKDIKMVTDVLVDDGIPWDDYMAAVAKATADRAEAAKKREEDVVFRAHNILTVSQLLQELGVDVIDEDEGFKFALSEAMEEELKACGVQPIPSWLNGYSIAATLLHAIGMLDLDDLKKLHS